MRTIIKIMSLQLFVLTVSLTGVLRLAASDLGRTIGGREDGLGGRHRDMPSMVASMSNGEAQMAFELSPNKDDGDESDNVLTSDINKFDWDIKLDKSGGFLLKWRVDEPANRITFGLSVDMNKTNFRPGTDIFALGFSERGHLSGSDFCLVWHDLGHQMHLQDAKSSSSNQLELIDGPESECQLVVDRWSEWEHDRRHVGVIFQRPLEVCRSGGRKRRDYYRIDDGTTHLVWFTLRGPVLSIEDLNLSELEAESAIDSARNSSARFVSGMNRVQLIAVKPPSGPLPPPPSSSSSSFDHNHSRRHHQLEIRMDNYSIPAAETTYWCRLFKLPAKFESRRYHITKYEAAISAGLEHVVHHMELFNCANLTPRQSAELEQLYESRGGWQGDCSSPERPRETEPCRRVVLAWAMGAKPLTYPDQVGQSIGGPGYSPYVVLEVHYNNVERESSLVDSSGLRFRYTSRLRAFEAGVLEVGLEYSDKNSVPPSMLAPLVGHCLGECTRAAMSNGTGSEGIFIFAGQMHTHLTGVASWTEHVRAGRLLDELQRDDHYSPHFQEIRLLRRPLHLLPGDALIHYCLYDTRSRLNITLGGFATSDEMCVTYLHYYPKIDLEVCKSSVSTRALGQYFEYLRREEGQRTSGRLEGEEEEEEGKSRSLDAEGESKAPTNSVANNYRSVDWSSARRRRELLQFYAEAPLSVQCNRSNGKRWPGPWEGLAPTRLWREQGGAKGPPYVGATFESSDRQVVGAGASQLRHAPCGRVGGASAQ